MGNASHFQDEDFAKSRNSSNKRRAGLKDINYNEKKADAALAKQIRQLVKDKTLNNKSTNGKIGKTTGLKRGSKNKGQTSNFVHQSFLQNKTTPWNFIPSLPLSYRNCNRFSTVLDTDELVVDLKKGTISSKSTVILKKNDHIYMVSEPAGEPYYIGRIVEIVPKQEYREFIDSSLDFLSTFPAIYFQLRMNWYYRPRDIRDNPQNVHPRLLYASLHNDLCPISSFRGKCNVEFSGNIGSLEMLHEYTSKPNNFYFQQLFDRYTLKYYQIIDTNQLSKNYGKQNYFFKVLSARYPFVFFEEKFPLLKFLDKYICGRLDLDQSWDLRCGECRNWSHTSESIKCDECNISMHLYCMDPPLEKKLVKGVVWVCSNCIAKQNNDKLIKTESYFEDLVHSAKFFDTYARNLKDISMNAENWWFQYIGEDICSHIEDCIRNDFLSPFPWKKSRISTQKSQWRGCTDPWQPKPYNDDSFEICERGSDTELLWKIGSSSDKILEEYVEKCKSSLSHKINIQPESCNFLDMIVKIFMNCGYDAEAAFSSCQRLITREALREPTFTPVDVAKFEEAIAQHGSELNPVCKHVSTQSMAMIVRFYYQWKKSPNGRKIWGNFKGRAKNQKKRKQNADLPASEITDSRKRSKNSKQKNNEHLIHVDDSSFDSDRISNVKALFNCMFCSVDYSPIWYRVTGGSDDCHISLKLNTRMTENLGSKSDHKNDQPGRLKTDENENKLDALCIRCARMWRRYAIKWQPPLETLKKLYGNSIGSLHAALTNILVDPNEQSLVCPKDQAFNKNVEWELIIDSEFISKQRKIIIENPERLGKMKKNSLAPHSQMNKILKKNLDPQTHEMTFLIKQLEDMIKLKAEEKRKKEEANLKRQKERETKESMILQEITAKSRTATESRSHRNGVFSEHSKQQEESLEKVEVKNSKDTSDDSSTPKMFIKKILQNGEFVIDVPDSNSPGELLGRVNIDSELTHVKIGRQLGCKLFQVECATTVQADNKEKMEDPSHIAKLSLRKEAHSQSRLLNRHNIPIINTDSPLFYDVCRFYNFSNPLYNRFYTKNNVPATTNKKYTFMSDENVVSKNKANMHPKSADTLPEKSNIDQLENTRPFCCVCFSGFSESGSDSAVCSNCGLSVHPYCYGLGSLLTDQPTSLKKEWLCDPCSNDRNPIVSTNYHCILCNAREMDHDAAKRGLSIAIPDALKSDVNGLWCHIICVVFGKLIKFASSPNYQPIINVKATLFLFNEKKCDICSLSGGLLVPCDCCDRKFHVTCCTDSNGYFVGLKRVNADVDTDKNISGFENAFLKPVIVCPSHQLTGEYLVFGERIKGYTLTALQLYLKEKSDDRLLEMSPLQLRNEEYSVITEFLKRGIENDENETLQCGRELKLQKCTVCSSTASILSNSNFCHVCNLRPLETARNLVLEDEQQIKIQAPKKESTLALMSKLDVGSLLHLSSRIKHLSTSNMKPAKARATTKGIQKVKHSKHASQPRFPDQPRHLSSFTQVNTGETYSSADGNDSSLRNDIASVAPK